MKRLEWLFHIIAFALQCGGIVPVFLRTGDSADLGEANPLNTIFTAFVLAITLVLLLPRVRTAFQYLPRMWPIMALTLLVVVSTSWSDYPNITLHRSISLTTSTLWSWYVVGRY